MAGGGIALLLEKMKGAPSKGDAPDDEAAEGEEPDMKKIRSLAEEAFPDREWSDDQLTALHELIRSCGEGDY